jgi:hypothetical protein
MAEKKKKKKNSPYLLPKQALELVLAHGEPVAVRTVHNPHESVRLLEIVAPVGPDGRLVKSNPEHQPSNHDFY